MTTDALIGPVQPPELHVMTYNIRRRLSRVPTRRADRWTRRRPLVQALLRAEKPSILGVQEALPDQARAVGEALGPRWRMVGHGRGPRGTGEGNPLFIDRERFELLDWSQQSLSEHPDEPGSRSWGNLVPRALVIATVRDRDTGNVLYVVNTHFDHLSGRARVRSAVAVRTRVAGQSHPAIVMGDLNAGEHSAAIRELFRAGMLRDAWTAAEERITPAWGTFADYRRPRLGGSRIDWIGVTESVTVTRAGVNDQRFDGSWPSDHLPVQIAVRVDGEAV